MAAIALHAEVFGADFDARRAGHSTIRLCGAQASAHGLPGRGGPQRLDHVEPRPTPWLAANDARRSPTRAAFLLLSCAPAAGATRLQLSRNLQLREQPRRYGRRGGCEHDVLERTIFIARLVLRGIARWIRRGFGLWWLLFLGGERRQAGRARGEHQPCRGGGVFRGYLGAAGEGRNTARSLYRMQRCAHGRHAQRERSAAERLDTLVVDRHGGHARPGGVDSCVIEPSVERFAHRHLVELDVERKALEQHRGRSLIVDAAFVQRSDHETRGCAAGHAITFDHDLTRLTGRRKPSSSKRTQSFGACNDDSTAVGSGQQALLHHGSTGPERRDQVETAEQAIVMHVGGNPAHRGASWQQRLEQVEPCVAHWARACAHAGTAACRIERT